MERNGTLCCPTFPPLRPPGLSQRPGCANGTRSASEFVNLLGSSPSELLILYLIFGPKGPKIRYLHKLCGGDPQPPVDPPPADRVRLTLPGR